MYSKIKYIPVAIVIAVLTYACASFGPLEGGKKDVDPPIVIESKPVRGALNFNGKKVQIIFNEFIQLKDIQKQFVISPPMKKAPIIIPKPKEIIINFEEELRPNVTYTLYFGNAITDFNEGNPIKKYDFVFSTGNQIDTLSVLGKILNATDHTPDKDGMYVMLYSTDNDSIPRKTLPSYITKSDDHGWFKFNHVHEGKYMIFGLKDMNMNYLFDQPAEPIAFSDTMVVFDASFYEKPDTSTHKNKPMAVKLKNPKDSTKIDTTDFYAGRTPRIEMYYFKEDVRKQYLNSFSRPKDNQFNLIFELPESDSLEVNLINDKKIQNWWVKDNILPNDTINFWITDTSLIHKDTLRVQVGYHKLDSVQRSYLKYDTIKLITKRALLPKNKKNDLKKKRERLSVNLSVSNTETVDLNRKIYFEPNQPVLTFDPSMIVLTRKEDTLSFPVKFHIIKDSILLRRYYLLFDYLSDTNYDLTIDSTAFSNVFNIYSDSTGVKFKTQKEDYYGTIKLSLKNIKGPTIIQLLSQKGDLVKEKRVYKDGKFTFDFLSPGKYKLKAIYDRNDNGIWDTGNWKQRLQPERTVFYNKDIPVRSNWDMEALWEFPLK